MSRVEEARAELVRLHFTPTDVRALDGFVRALLDELRPVEAGRCSWTATLSHGGTIGCVLSAGHAGDHDAGGFDGQPVPPPATGGRVELSVAAPYHGGGGPRGEPSTMGRMPSVYAVGAIDETDPIAVMVWTSRQAAEESAEGEVVVEYRPLPPPAAANRSEVELLATDAQLARWGEQADSILGSAGCSKEDWPFAKDKAVRMLDAASHRDAPPTGETCGHTSTLECDEMGCGQDGPRCVNCGCGADWHRRDAARRCENPECHDGCAGFKRKGDEDNVIDARDGKRAVSGDGGRAGAQGDTGRVTDLRADPRRSAIGGDHRGDANRRPQPATPAQEEGNRVHQPGAGSGVSGWMRLKNETRRLEWNSAYNAGLALAAGNYARDSGVEAKDGWTHEARPINGTACASPSGAAWLLNVAADALEPMPSNATPTEGPAREQARRTTMSGDGLGATDDEIADALRAEIGDLENELSRQVSQRDLTIRDLRTQLTAALAARDEALKCLRWYADPDNYEEGEGPGHFICEEQCAPGECDCNVFETDDGEKARATLAKLETP